MINGKLFENMQRLDTKIKKIDRNECDMLLSRNGLTVCGENCVVYAPAAKGAICENALISPFKPVFGALGTVDIDAKTLAAVLSAFKGRVRIESTVENTGSAILLQIYEVGGENKQAAIYCEREASLE